MEDKEAIRILTKLLENQTLNKKEKEAISVAIGALSLALLVEKKIQRLGERKRKRDLDIGT